MSLAAALEQLVPVAFEKLKQTAKTYNAFVTYKELGDAAKEATGIRYDATYRWVGKLLGPIVWRCKEEGLPPLTSLVVHADDHSVGEGYDEVFRAAGLPVPEGSDKIAQLDDHAAASRLECYRHFGAELPPDGGVPTLTPKIKAARDASKSSKPRPLQFCEIHNIALPATGRCDECD
ncbi:hypothetical protein [Mycobacterium sp.]|uniref:hypothetical protein n=1 Tax=Mycobacterium sp. TaxID=1785 RepID=UPI002CAB782E|nr:hypothetical protein [Mycobacterium sp.]HKP42106.1 hypothetical protein [Mycobacterium sp.]